MIQINRTFPADGMEGHQPRFEVGQIVRHKRYGYRGVVAAVDGYCKATPDWYLSNQTQPDRNQPWYHVLVDGNAATTYPAEQNLMLDQTGRPIDHPLLDVFFTGFENGHYLRSDVPWPPSHSDEESA